MIGNNLNQSISLLRPQCYLSSIYSSGWVVGRGRLLRVGREDLLEEVSFAWTVRRIQPQDNVGNRVPGCGISKCKVGSSTKAL